MTRVVLEQMLAGASTRRFTPIREPVGQDAVDVERSTSKSAVSREFVGRPRGHLQALMSRPLADVRLTASMLDAIELKGRCCVVALGVTTGGVKVALRCGTARPRTRRSPRICSPTSSTAGWTSSRLVVLDGSNALRTAVSEVFGAATHVEADAATKSLRAELQVIDGDGDGGEPPPEPPALALAAPVGADAEAPGV